MVRSALEIRVRGRVQGVGFRPNVYRVARELGLSGTVRNDAEGVLIQASGAADALAALVERLAREAPPLARIEALETRPLDAAFDGAFTIAPSARSGAARTEIAPDARTCDACASEVLAPAGRRSGYPFTTCTHCGPRLSVVRAIPYDRARTTMAAFPLCAACAAEYGDPGDRRFHAETTACPECGPALGAAMTPGLLESGAIVAVKGLGGYHLACDATRADVVQRLRERKGREAKPFALMARDLDVIRRYCRVSSVEEALLNSAEAPIVLLGADGPETLPDGIAPGHRTLGFMLPTTPLHLVLLRDIARPVVMTSGNISDSPALIADDAADTQLRRIADHVVSHDRVIASRVDDSIARVMDGRPRLLRRARGYAPAPIVLPAGFDEAPPLLAYGADLKSTFCLLGHGEAVLSQHQGDLEDASTFEDYRRNLALYAALFEHAPRALVVDRHPDYPSSVLGRERGAAEGLPILEVQHHHAHVAACLAENGHALAGAPVLGIVLDGLGLGDEGELWGGEFLLADYRSARRLGTFKPVALIGGDKAAREPWRNLYAHLVAELGWAELTTSFGDLEVRRLLERKPLGLVDQMLASGTNVPRASSCGRLFDAVAAAIGITFDRQAYEGQAGAMLEALVDDGEPGAYPFAIRRLASGLPSIEPLEMWRALLGDLAQSTPPGIIAARFHHGLARAVTAMAIALRGAAGFDTVVLSGGCFQNRVLFEETIRLVRDAGLHVLTHAEVPPNDGGIALGQAAVGAARLM